MTSILDRIITNTRQEVSQREALTPLSELTRALQTTELHPIRPFAQSLMLSETGIIAEFKRKSPSLGWIKEEGSASVIPPSYAKHGASALSILTDEVFFGGHLDFLRTTRQLVNLPLLRKDFIVSDYQIYEARLAGADAILLIAAALSVEECKHLAQTAQSLGLEVLLEVHNEEEINHFCDGITAIGVNNRDLKTFQTSLETSERLASLLPSEVIRVTESGLHSPEDVLRLRACGYRGFLMGERFMKTEDPGKALADFITSLNA